MLIQFLRGTTAQNNAYTGLIGSVTFDTELNQLRVHDGVTAGGHVVSDVAAIADLQDQIDNLGIADISGLQAALDAKVAASLIGANNGIASLDAGGRVPAAQLPSYVDDVLEFADEASLPGTGETGKIYITLDANQVWRWSGSAYVEIVASPGTTDNVAEGSTNLYFTVARARGAISVAGDLTYDDETGVISYTTPTYTKADVGLGNVENYAVASQAEAEAGTATDKYMTPQRTRQFVEVLGFVYDAEDGWTLDLGTMS